MPVSWSASGIRCIIRIPLSRSMWRGRYWQLYLCYGEACAGLTVGSEHYEWIVSTKFSLFRWRVLAVFWDLSIWCWRERTGSGFWPLGWNRGWMVAETAPIVIANGGSSGIYPDQTSTSYNDAVNSTALPLALLCDLQLTKDNKGICRQGWNLSETTNITIILTNTSVQSTYVIQGQSLTGYFSVDYTSKQLQNLTGVFSCELQCCRS